MPTCAWSAPQSQTFADLRTHSERARIVATMGCFNTPRARLVIDARFLRILDWSASSGEPPAGHLSAASGMVRIGQRLFIVADDELCLGVFDLHTENPGRMVRLFGGELPSLHRERKALKPDFEALTALPAFTGYPFGALLGIGSGSKPNRQRAALLRLDERGTIDGSASHVDLAPMYDPLRTRFADLNIEGLFVSGSEFCLLQRGNRKSQANACIRFDWQEVERWIQGATVVPSARSISVFDLGGIDGVPLCFTDGAALQGSGWVFCAAAEDTSDSYSDGRCMGSVVGIVSADGKLAGLEQVAGVFKAEGIAVASDDDEGLELLLVTDADDRRAAAQLLSVTLPRTG